VLVAVSPSFFTRLAARFFARRWWFFVISLFGMALLFAAFSSGSAQVAALAGTFAGPVIFVPWALLCACVWFHPEHGNLQPGSKLIGKLPNAVQIGVRWYASLFLALFFVVGTVVWPALSLAWL
jgi:hypothetical protein